MDNYFLVIVLLAIIVGIVSFILFFFFLRKDPKEKKSNQSENVNSNSSVSEVDEPVHAKRSKLKEKFRSRRKSGLGPHPLLAADFKGHTDTVLSLSFEPGGKYLASSSKDGTIRVWLMKTVDQKEKKYGRVNIDFYATHVAFSPDGTAVVSVSEWNHYNSQIIVYKILKQKNSVTLPKALEFSLSPHPIVSLGIAPNGTYIMTCNDNEFDVWSLKGEKLSSVNSHQSPNTCAAVSHCSKFIGCCGFTPGVKMYEVEFDKGGAFKQVSRVMDLNGHSASVLSLCFSVDSKRAATVSKDKTCRIWNIDVQYMLNEDTKCLMVIPLHPTEPPCHVALSPDVLVVAVAINTSVLFYSVGSGKLLEELSNIHNDVISQLIWEPNGHYLVSAGGEDRYIRLWHNVPGMREQIKDNEEKLRKASSEPLKVRLKEKISQLRESIKKFEQN